MGKGQFKLRLGKKSNRELNPMEKWRRKLKERDKLKRLVGRLSHKDDFPNPRKPRKRKEEDEEIGTQDPMLGDLMTTNRLRGEEEQPQAVSDGEEHEPIVKKTEAQVDRLPEKEDVMVPSSCIVKRPVSIAPMPKNPVPEELSDDEDLDSLAVDSFLVSVAAPAQSSDPIKTVRQQPNFKRMLNEDKDMADFYEHMGSTGDVSINLSGCQSGFVCPFIGILTWVTLNSTVSGSTYACAAGTDLISGPNWPCKSRAANKDLVTGTYPKQCLSTSDCALKDGSTNLCVCAAQTSSTSGYCKPDVSSSIFEDYWTDCLFNGTIKDEYQGLKYFLEQEYEVFYAAKDIPGCANTTLFEFQQLVRVQNLIAGINSGLGLALSVLYLFIGV